MVLRYFTMLSPALSTVNLTMLRRVLLSLNPGEFSLSFQHSSTFSLPLQIFSSSGLMFLILQLLFLGQVSLLPPASPPPSLTLCFTCSERRKGEGRKDTESPGGSDSRESACSAGDLGSVPGLGRSPGGGHSNPLQYSCLDNPHGQRSLAGCSPWDHKESDMTERLSTHSLLTVYL